MGFGKWKKRLCLFLAAGMVLSSVSAYGADTPQLSAAEGTVTQEETTEASGQEPEAPEQEPEAPEQETGEPEQEPEAPGQETGEPEQEPEAPGQETGEPEQEPETPEQVPGAPEQEIGEPKPEEIPQTPQQAPPMLLPAIDAAPIPVPLVENQAVSAFLQALAANEDVTLTEDLTLGADWTPIAYGGTIDGNGHTITLQGNPLFDNFSGTARNLILDGNVTSEKTVGAFAVTMSGGLMENCLSKAYVNGTSWNDAAGFVGNITGGTVQGCVCTGTITPGKFSKGYGIAVSASNAVINFCFWTDTEVQGAAKNGTITNSQLLTEENKTECLDLLNQVAGISSGLRFWQEENGVLSPTGEVSSGGGSIVVDTEALLALLEQLEQLDSSAYWYDSWEYMAAQMEQARTILDSPYTTQADVDGAVATLEEAKGYLIFNTSFSKLETQVELALKIRDESAYTAESWQQMIQSRQKAYNILGNLYSGYLYTDEKVQQAADELEIAIENLVEIGWTEIGSVEELQGIDGTGRYRLTADLVGYESVKTVLSGTLDGNGHQITFAAGSGPLFSEISGTVKNLGLDGEVQGGGAFAEILNGTIFNCYSWATVTGGEKPAGGVAGTACTGGYAAIENTYICGEVTGSVAGGLVGSWQGKEKWSLDCAGSFWVNGTQAVADADEEEIFGGQQVTAERLAEDDFREVLNEARKDGTLWTKSEGGLPYFGPDFAPQTVFYPVVMKDLVTFQTERLEESGTLETDVFGTKEGYVAQLSLEGYDGKVYWDTTQPGNETGTDYPAIVSASTGEVYVRDTGKIKVTARKDWAYGEEIQSFYLDIVLPDQFVLYLYAGGEDYTGKTYDFLGESAIHPYVSVGGYAPEEVYSGLFRWNSSNYNIVTVDSLGGISVNEDGSAVITASLGSVNASMTVTSTYEPVTGITSRFEGTYSIHGRNPNSIGQNDTPGIADFNALYELDENGEPDLGTMQKVAIVEPKNATYSSVYDVSTGDTDILEYYTSLRNNLVPKKAGTTTITVTTRDAKLSQQFSDTTTVTLEYLNPLTSLTAKETALTVATKETVDAGLIFTGPKSAPSAEYPDGLHVSESGMTWSQTGDGKVKVYRSYPVIMIDDAAAFENEGTVSNDQWLIEGVEEGTVTLVGTPTDVTYQGDPITLTITVTKGEDVPVLSPEEQVAAALEKTSQYQLSKLSTPTFGQEWSMLSLARSGQMTEERKQMYLARVLETVEKEAGNVSCWDNKVTEVQRLSLALTAMGVNPQDVQGVDLLDYSWNKETYFTQLPDGSLGAAQGSNELIYGLLATSAHPSFVAPAQVTCSSEQMVERLLSQFQLEEGGFSLYGNDVLNMDITGMALQALAAYEDMPQVSQAVEKTVERLSQLQGSDGGYGTAETTSQVVLGLVAVGIDPARDARFIKDGTSLLDGLMLYAKEDGSFCHGFGGNGDPMATEQAFYTLVGLSRFYEGNTFLYDMSDVTFGDLGGAEVTGIKVTPEEPQVKVGNTVQLKAIVLPATAENRAVQWASADETIAQVDETGLVKGIAPGKVKITATTVEGGFVAEAWVTVEKKSGGETTPTQFVTLSIDRLTIGEGYILEPTQVEVTPGESVWDVLQRELDNRGISYRVSENQQYGSIYVEAIDGLGEFDEGPGSGWKYSVNGVYPDYGCSLYELSGGEVIRWRYTTNLGADLEGGSSAAEGTSSATAPISPTIKPNLKGEVQLSYDLEELVAAMEQAGDTPYFYLQLETEEPFSSLEMKLAADALSRFYREEKGLMLETPFATLTVENEALLPLLDMEKEVSFEMKQMGEKEWMAAVTADGEEVTGVLARLFVPGKFAAGEILCQTAEGTMITDTIWTKDGLWANVSLPCQVQVVAAQKAFLDVPEDFWAKEAVDFVTARGLFVGTSEELFSPNHTMTRAMVASVLHRMEGTPEVEGNHSFTDVQEGDWFAPAALWVEEAGVFVGDGTEFLPNEAIRREELAVALVREAKRRGVELPKGSDLSGYADEGEISAWAKEELAVAVEAGLIKGKDESTLAPKGMATRAEVAAMVQRFYDWMK